MDHLLAFTLQTGATLIGLLVGTLAALTIDRRKDARKRRTRAKITLRSLDQEIAANHDVLLTARPSFHKTPWGRSFYLSTTAWETALSNTDLPAIIGFRLADELSEHYGILVGIRYHLDLLTRLWMAPRDIDGHEGIRIGFHLAISRAMDAAISRHDRVTMKVKEALRAERAEVPVDRRHRLAKEQTVAMARS